MGFSIATGLVCALVFAAPIVASGSESLVLCEPCAKPCITDIGETPWVPPQRHVRPKVIYGEDDRLDVYEETDPQRISWAASSCALIYLSRLTQHSDGSWALTSPAAYRRLGLPPCDDEPFGDQPTAAYCSGFVVGSDLIVTAGHCYNTNSLAGTRFVFGFWMENAATPRMHFYENEVYQGVEIVSFAGSGDYDHALVRVDRPITAPGAIALAVRRTGSVEPGEYMGVIGHPAGLPMKLAFGETYVRSSQNAGYFVANLDTYGGNSGSPVFNANTGLVEGILVRGATDFIRNDTDNCFMSNVYPNDGGRGEDVTRTTVFEEHIPVAGGYNGSLEFDSAYYRCEDVLRVTVTDSDLIDAEETLVSFETTSGDAETLSLLPSGVEAGEFTGVIALQFGPPSTNSGILEVYHADIISAYYDDERDAAGMAATVTATAEVDCQPPEVINVAVGYISAAQAQVQVTTSEPSYITVHYGEACAAPMFTATSTLNTYHAVALNGLQSGTDYHFSVIATDQAGNETFADSDGACYAFLTQGEQEYFTENFTGMNPVDIDFRQLTFTPIDLQGRYWACITSVAALPVTPDSGRIMLEDDSFIEMPFTHGAPVMFYGIPYDRMFIGSNGYITFGVGDSAYQPFYSLHFQVPRFSGLMCDLNPEAGGEVYSERLSDRSVVTFVDVPEYSGDGDYLSENKHTFQMEIFFNGVLRVTWLDVFTTTAVVGLSAGFGAPEGFSSSNLTGLMDCADIMHDGLHHSADTDENWRISSVEVLRVVQLYNAGEYHCSPLSDDGYALGSGARVCLSHDSDYAPIDWRISLSEILRLIQLHNAGGYLSDLATEDGFRPFP